MHPGKAECLGASSGGRQNSSGPIGQRGGHVGYAHPRTGLPPPTSTIAQVLLVNVADMLGRHAHYTHAQVNMILADIFAVGVFVLGCISDNLAVRVSAWCWAACRTIWQSG